jgi:hypothetical protein
MRLRTRTWIVLSVALFVAAGVMWHLGNQRVERARGEAKRSQSTAGQVNDLVSSARGLSPSDPRVSSMFAQVITNAPNAPQQSSRGNALSY